MHSGTRVQRRALSRLIGLDMPPDLPIADAPPLSCGRRWIPNPRMDDLIFDDATPKNHLMKF